MRLPPHVRAALAKRRGTKAQREAAMAAQAPLDVPGILSKALDMEQLRQGRIRRVEWPCDPAKLQKARDLVRDRDEQTLAARRKRFVKAISPRNRETPED